MTDDGPRGRSWHGQALLAAALLAFAALPATLPAANGGGGTPSAEAPARFPPAGIAAGAVLHHPLSEGLGLRVEVPAEEPADGGSVDLVIFEEAPGGLILGRLSTRRVGQLRNSWRTDLDDDDQPEYLLAFAAPASAASDATPDSLQMWEWQAGAHAFARVELPPLETAAPILEQRLLVRVDHLDWQVVLVDEDGVRVQATYRLDLDEARWERRRRWLPW